MPELKIEIELPEYFELCQVYSYGNSVVENETKSLIIDWINKDETQRFLFENYVNIINEGIIGLDDINCEVIWDNQVAVNNELAF